MIKGKRLRPVVLMLKVWYNMEANKLGFNIPTLKAGISDVIGTRDSSEKTVEEYINELFKLDLISIKDNMYRINIERVNKVFFAIDKAEEPPKKDKK